MILFKKENAAEAYQVDELSPGYNESLNGVVVDLGSGNTTIAQVGQWVVTQHGVDRVFSNSEVQADFYQQNRNLESQFEQNSFESIRRGKRIVVRITQTMHNEGVNVAGRTQVYNALSNFIPICQIGDLEVARNILNGVNPIGAFTPERKTALLAYVDSLIPD